MIWAHTSRLEPKNVSQSVLLSNEELYMIVIVESFNEFICILTELCIVCIVLSPEEVDSEWDQRLELP